MKIWKNLLEKSLTLINNKKVKDVLQTQVSALKHLTPKPKVEIFPIALTQVKASNTSKKVLNEMRQILYSLYWEKEVT